MSKPRFGRFTLRTDCARCGQPLPVNAPAQTAHCAHCQSDVTLPAAIRWHVLGTFDESHHDLHEGRGDSKTLDVGGLTVHYEFARAAPPPEPAASFEAPSWLRDLVTNARHVYVTDASAAPGAPTGSEVPPKAGRQPEGDSKPEAPKTDAARPVVMTCPQCGAALHVTAASERTVACQFCNVDVFLSDDLWRRLHPVKVVEPWWVRFEGSTRARERAEREAAERRRHGAELRVTEKREQFLATADVVRDAAVARARRHAMGAVTALYTLMIAALAAVGAGLTTDLLGDASDAACIALVALAVLCSGVAVYLGGRVLVLREGPEGGSKMPLAWMMLGIGFVAPIGGQIDHLAMGILALSGSFGGKAKGTTKEHVTASRRETLPLALVFFALTLWWPLAAVGLANVLQVHVSRHHVTR